MNLAYIQARGGSKRFPRKNLALWNGIPMVADAIQKAKATGLFDFVVVSSDDTEILQVAHDYGALPLWRTPEASSDTATDDDVAREVLAYFPRVHIVCKLYPCIPLITDSDISKLHTEYQMTNKDGTYFVSKNGKDAGAAYIFERYVLDLHNTIALDKIKWTKKITDHACDINTPEDLEKAKRMAGL